MTYMTHMMINQLMRVVILLYSDCIQLSLSFWQPQDLLQEPPRLLEPPQVEPRRVTMV